ncbi:unnamed protein product [Diabrotica balteata]|uniref:CCHC-type domain-containing protein n=1 Tax=Diabrotica balteata TaxID=107213 RepID=A0A9N9XEJ7_DIABA|nr:unnamed protein product [Diabrotica balteata]
MCILANEQVDKTGTITADSPAHDEDFEPFYLDSDYVPDTDEDLDYVAETNEDVTVSTRTLINCENEVLPIAPCNRCRLKCPEQISEDKRQGLLNYFYGLSDKIKQRGYLARCIMKVLPKRKRSSNAKRKENFRYYFEVDGQKSLKRSSKAPFMESSKGGEPPDKMPRDQDAMDDCSYGSHGFSSHQLENSISSSNNINNLKTDKQITSLNSNETEKSRPVYLYEKTDLGPFHIFIENNDKNFTVKLNAVKLGEILFTVHPEIDTYIKKIDSIGRNRIRITFKKYASANTLITSKLLIQKNLIAYIPQFQLFKLGVVRDIESDIWEEYLKDKIKEFDHHCKFSVDYVKRIKRKIVTDNKVVFKPTKSVIVSFKCQNLPKYIVINHVLHNVEKYQQKVIICYNCYRYGHMSKQCKSNPRCLKCLESHHSDSCSLSSFNKKYLSCEGEHFTNKWELCPEFDRQKKIKHYMSENSLSFKEMLKLFPKVTYASITANNSSINSHQIPIMNAPSFSYSSTQLSTSPSLPNQLAYPTVSNRYTIIKPPKSKRPISSSQDPIAIEHQKIIKLNPMSNRPGGIFNSSSYQSTFNAEQGSKIHESPKELTELISNIVINNMDWELEDSQQSDKIEDYDGLFSNAERMTAFDEYQSNIKKGRKSSNIKDHREKTPKLLFLPPGASKYADFSLDNGILTIHNKEIHTENALTSFAEFKTVPLVCSIFEKENEPANLSSVHLDCSISGKEIVADILLEDIELEETPINITNDLEMDGTNMEPVSSSSKDAERTLFDRNAHALKKRKLVNRKEWKKPKNKNLRMQGEAYLGYRRT